MDSLCMPSVTKQLCALLEQCLAAQRNKYTHVSTQVVEVDYIVCFLR